MYLQCAHPMSTTTTSTASNGSWTARTKQYVTSTTTDAGQSSKNTKVNRSSLAYTTTGDSWTSRTKQYVTSTTTETGQFFAVAYARVDRSSSTHTTTDDSQSTRVDEYVTPTTEAMPEHTARRLTVTFSSECSKSERN